VYVRLVLYVRNDLAVRIERQCNRALTEHILDKLQLNIVFATHLFGSMSQLEKNRSPVYPSLANTWRQWWSRLLWGAVTCQRMSCSNLVYVVSTWGLLQGGQGIFVLGVHNDD